MTTLGRRSQILLVDDDAPLSPPLQAIAQGLCDPLHGLLGCAQLMLADPEHPLHPVQAHRLDRIIDASHHLQRVMRDVSDLSQLASHNLEMHLETIDVLDCLQEALRQVEAESTARSVHLSLGALPPSTLVRGDPSRLRQAFSNLLGLLFHGAPMARHIELRFKAVGTRLRISAVELPQESSQARHLPLPLRQARSPRASWPHGGELKWSLSQQLVHAMGGQLKVSGAAGSDSDLFELMLPAMPSERPATRQ